MFKKKVDDSDRVKYKARLVIREFKDKNNYELTETYTPVSRLPLIRSFLAIANKIKFRWRQLDIETAFLYGDIDTDIFVEIPEGITDDVKTRQENIWKLFHSLYGLKISPKKWNDKFKSEIEKLKFISTYLDPCLFVRMTETGVMVALLYVDDILMMEDDVTEIDDVIRSLNLIFTIKNLGDPKEYLTQLI